MALSTFEKGLSKEFSPLKQTEGTYIDAQNIIRDRQGTVHTEPGTTPIVDFTTDVMNNGSSFTLPGADVIGNTTVNTYIYYFIVSQRGSSIVRVDTKNKLAELVLHTGIQEVNGGEVEV